MGATTKIEWADHTANPMFHALGDNLRRWNKKAAKEGVIHSVAFQVDNQDFDFFGNHEVDADIIDGFRQSRFSLIDECQNLLFLLTTKQPGNVRQMVTVRNGTHRCSSKWKDYYRPNVALIASISDQQSADELIPDLLGCRQLVKYLGVSAEPLVGPVDLGEWLCPCDDCNKCIGECGCKADLDLCIIGGESGPNARPCNVEDIRSLIAQCKAAEVPCFVKQLGGKPIDTLKASNVLQYWPVGTMTDRMNDQRYRMVLKDPKGGNPEEWPEDLRVRQLPWRAE